MMKPLLQAAFLITLTFGLSACDMVHPKPPADTPPDIAAAAGSKFSADGKLNINNMSLAELRARIPKINDRMAYEFFEYQPYKSIEKFRGEMLDWTDQNTINEYEKKIFIPINVKSTDIETVMQIPGMTMIEAKLLVAMQPHESNEAFLKVMGESLAKEQVEVAETYLCSDPAAE